MRAVGAPPVYQARPACHRPLAAIVIAPAAINEPRVKRFISISFVWLSPGWAFTHVGRSTRARGDLFERWAGHGQNESGDPADRRRVGPPARRRAADASSLPRHHGS